MESLQTAFRRVRDGDESAKEKVDELNARVAEMERAIVAYLIKISSQDVSLTDEKLVSAIQHVHGRHPAHQRAGGQHHQIHAQLPPRRHRILARA